MSATTTPFPEAVIFDAYGTLFDVHSAVAAAQQMSPGHGNTLSQLWRLKQIEPTRPRTLAAPAGSRYQPFRTITLDTLRFAAHKPGLTLTAAAQQRLMDESACLSARPDAMARLRQLRDVFPEDLASPWPCTVCLRPTRHSPGT
jgi:2-haloacid dehalogenase